MALLLHVAFVMALYSLLAMSLELLVGEMGLPVLGHAGFVLAGAYAAGLLSIHFHVGSAVSLTFGGISAALLAVIVAWPCLRLKGDYLALATLGFGIIIHSIATNWIGLTGGPMGLTDVPGASLFGMIIEETWAYALLTWSLVAVCFLVLRVLLERPFGLVVRAIREDELATLALGKAVPWFKLRAFFVSGFVAGLAGGLYGQYMRFLHPDSFSVTLSLNLLLMVVLGGLGSLRGSIVGASLLASIPEALRFVGVSVVDASKVQQILFGVVLVVLILFRPQGILGKYAWK